MSRSDKKKSSTAELWEMFVLLFSALRPHLERVPTSEQPPPPWDQGAIHVARMGRAKKPSHKKKSAGREANSEDL